MGDHALLLNSRKRLTIGGIMVVFRNKCGATKKARACFAYSLDSDLELPPPSNSHRQDYSIFSGANFQVEIHSVNGKTSLITKSKQAFL